MQADIQSRLSTVERQLSYSQKQRSGATGEESDYGKNGRANSEGAESRGGYVVNFKLQKREERMSPFVGLVFRSLYPKPLGLGLHL